MYWSNGYVQVLALALKEAEFSVGYYFTDVK